MPEPTPLQTGNAIQGIWNSEKGFLTALALIGATVLCAIGRMTIDQWTGFVEVIMVAYIGGKTITTVGTAIAGRPAAIPDAGSNAANVTTNVVTPPAQPSPTPAEPTALVTGQRGIARLPLLVAIATFGAMLAFLGSCGAARGVGNAAAGALVDCTTAAAKDAITQYSPLVENALQHATGGDGAIDLPSFKSATKNLAASTGMCALASVVNAALAPLRDPNAPKTSPLEADPKALKAAFDELRATTAPGRSFKLEGATL